MLSENPVIAKKVSPFEMELAHLLYTIAEFEMEIEESRKALSENEKFNAYDAFLKLDRFNHGYLNVSDIIFFFSANHIPVLERECFYLYNYYNEDLDKGMIFQEFLKIITPITDPDLRDRFLRRGSKKKIMPFFLIDQLAALFQKELEFFKQTETLKMVMMHKYSWNAIKAFNLIDVRNKGFINFEDVAAFMSKASKVFHLENYKALMRRLDRDRTQTLTKNEFCEAILPNDIIDMSAPLMNQEINDLEYYNTPNKELQEKIYHQEIEDDKKKRKYLNKNLLAHEKEVDNIFEENKTADLKYLQDFFMKPNDIIGLQNEIFIKQYPPKKNEVAWKVQNDNNLQEVNPSVRKSIFDRGSVLPNSNAKNLMESVSILDEKRKKDQTNQKDKLQFLFK